MIRTVIICFTENGLKLGKRIIDEAASDIYEYELYAKYSDFDIGLHKDACKVNEDVSTWTSKMQKERCAIIFIGAMGIAVRAIASGLENKLTDSPVIVIDELGINVIPVVAGHVGGANQLALHIAKSLNANPVITTATDIEEKFSVDLLAKENNFSIYNKEGIAKVSAKSLEGKPIRISIENYPPERAEVIVSSDKAIKDSCDILLCPRKYAIGIGCKKETSFENLNELFLKITRDNNVDVNDIGAIASIDLKSAEKGLLNLCGYYRIPFITYDALLLEKAQGDFTDSEFVRETTGVGNVCERAAMLLTNNKGTIIQKKHSENGMTIAIAKME